MSRLLPPLNALRAFEAAGRHQSFSRAAAELNVSHSAISRHVRGLEDRLGVQLFQEAGIGVALSEDGRAYLAQISPALDAIAEATEAVGEGPEGRVTINSDPLFAQTVIAPELGYFVRDHPDIELRLVASNALADVDRYEADFALRFAHTGRLERPADLVSDAPIFPYAAPGMFDAPPSVAQILRAPRVQDRLVEIWHEWAAVAGMPLGEEVQSTWRLRAPLALAAARGGGMVYLAGADTTNADCRAGALQRLSEVSLQTGAYYLVARDGHLRRKALRVVRSWLLDLTAPFRAGPFWEVDQPLG